MTAPTLTAAELAYYRDLIGDVDVGNFDLDNPSIQAAYDRAYAFDDDDADMTEARTMVYLLRRLLGRARKKIDARGDAESESFGQLFDHIKDMLDEWEGRAGMSGSIGGIGVGSLDLNLSCDEVDEWAS